MSQGNGHQLKEHESTSRNGAGPLDTTAETRPGTPGGVHEVVIIGSGPAGYTAAIYAARAELKPLMFSGLEPGGQLMTTTDVENFPGFPQGVMGPDMMTLFRDQAARFGTDIRDQSIQKLDATVAPFRMWTDAGEEILAHSVILSTGASAKWLGLESETKFRGHGVSACATCDGFFFRGKIVAVVGGGDTAMEETHFLSKFATKVYLIHRRESFRASKIMQDRVLEDPKVEVLWNSEVLEVLGEEEPFRKVTGLRIGSTAGGPESHLDVDGLFLAIGHKPNSDLVRDQIETDEVGYVKVEPGRTYTSIEGLFAAGDVADPVYRQAVSAAGTGCMAALDAERFLSSRPKTTASPRDETPSDFEPKDPGEEVADTDHSAGVTLPNLSPQAVSPQAVSAENA